MLAVRDLSLRRGGKCLFEHVSFAVYPGDKIALIGKNGTGKSSLFALIRGELLPDSGDIEITGACKIASVRQETPSSDLSALDYVLSADEELNRLSGCLKDAEARDDGMAIAEAHAALEKIGAYGAPARAARLLSGLGFAVSEHGRAVKTFSGGWRMRLNLAQALMQRADLLLLDEPTNHLDLETVLWLENHLNDSDAALLVISHDRDFLNSVTRRTMELAQNTLHLYGGNYDFYEGERAARMARQASLRAKQEAQRRHLQAFVDRFRYKAGKARQAQSRLKALAKLEQTVAAHCDDGFSFAFAEPETRADFPLILEGADIGYADRILIRHADLRLESGGRYGLLGVNGSGKSTLIRVLVGDLPPLSGSLKRADKIRIGYFAQHQSDALRNDWSPLTHVLRLSPAAKESEVRSFLGGFGFSGDTAISPVAPMSGGEKARLALALLIWQKPNVLIMDEPTNHLDLDMRHALTVALQDFGGALLLVSHDRRLSETVCDGFFVIEEQKLSFFEGDLDDYRARRLAQNHPSAAPASSTRKEEKRREAGMRQEISLKIKPLQKIIAVKEGELDKLQREKERAEVFLASEEAYNAENKVLLSETLNRLNEVNRRLAEAENDWLAAQESIERIRREARLNSELRK